MPDQHDPAPVPVRIVGPPLTGAQKRKRAGLATAGTGFLLADRAKSMAPGAADWTTRSAKKIGAEEHAARVAHKTALIGRHGARTGAALATAGLLLAGQGALSDAKDKAKAKLKERQGKGPEMVDVPTNTSLLPSPFGKRETIMDGTSGSAFFAKADDRRQAGNYAALGAGGGTAGAVLAGGGIRARRNAVAGSQQIREKVRLGQHTAEDIAHSNELHGLYRLGTKMRNVGVLGGGAALAAGTTGAVIHARRARAQANDGLGKSAFFAKADEPHPDDETNPGVLRVRAGQATAAQKKSQGKAGGWASLGATGAVGGAAVAAAAHETQEDLHRSVRHLGGQVEVRQALGRGGATPGEMRHAVQLGRNYRAMGRVKVGGLVGGGASLAAGIPLAVHHARKANKQGQEATALRLRAARSEYDRQSSPVGKAFDPETQRHKRAAIYEGAATGGAVVAGTGAGVLQHKANQMKGRGIAGVAEGQKLRHEVHVDINQMAQKPPRRPPGFIGPMRPVPKQAPRGPRLAAADKKLATATRLETEAGKTFKTVRNLRYGARGAAVAAGALGATAIGVHRSDRFGSGRSYGYY